MVPRQALGAAVDAAMAGIDDDGEAVAGIGDRAGANPPALIGRNRRAGGQRLVGQGGVEPRSEAADMSMAMR